ncbi:uncharacterized protein N7458_004155 [Penicillium daleae]|uniref:GTP cyclohydrolase 1 n=1 Tax=Penicillium daleae TaxID=63821 RepID=A0AAD6CAH6_9EURO|nr:uncharacterized protein N7458_004155 [Penicillium daleae]KAJ5455891.1 hypothetical protein N7458_004155 [Penicillium daleae]
MPSSSQTGPINSGSLFWPASNTASQPPGSGTLKRLESTPKEHAERMQKLEGAARTILECIGEDPDREGLLNTPKRYAEAMLFLSEGYGANVPDILTGATFKEKYDNLVIVKDIDIFSLCEHHMLPFTGKVHIGYIPREHVIGLSKLTRLAEVFSRRLQIQERLTSQIATAISDLLGAYGVGVVMECSHLCMEMRGVQKVGSVTTTICMLGSMRSDAAREEFLTLLNRR